MFQQSICVCGVFREIAVNYSRYKLHLKEFKGESHRLVSSQARRRHDTFRSQTDLWAAERSEMLHPPC